MNAEHYRIHTMPVMPALRVTGAAARSVAAADEAGRAEHQAIIDAQTAMIAHDQAIPEGGIDATWAAESIRLAKRELETNVAAEGLATRWGQSVQWLRHRDTPWSLARTWAEQRNAYAEKLKLAGVPPVTATEDAAAWDDAAARGC